MERILWHGVDGAFVASDDGGSRFLRYPEHCGSPATEPVEAILREAGHTPQEWTHLTNFNPNEQERGSVSSRDVVHTYEGIYGRENVLTLPRACDFEGRALPTHHSLYVRKTALDLKRELSPDRAFETH